MAIIPKILKGGLDLNSSVATIAPANYIDAVDVTDKSVNLKSGQNIWQLNNNADYAFSVGSIVEQPKIYKFTIDFNIGGDPEYPTLSFPKNTDLVFTLEKAGSYRDVWITIDDGGNGQTLDWWDNHIQTEVATWTALVPFLTLVDQTNTSLTYTLSIGRIIDLIW